MRRTHRPPIWDSDVGHRWCRRRGTSPGSPSRVFDFKLTDDELAAIDRLDTDRRGGPEPSDITLDSFGRPIPED
jgi:hypothetical protein